MRFTRNGLLSAAAAVLVAVASVTAVPAPASAARKSWPHPVGGYVQPSTLAKAKPKAYAADELPASVDLRSHLPAVGNQGQVGSCVAWAIAYQIMGYYAERTDAAGAPYAPLFLYMRTVTPGGAPSTGTNPEVALANALNGGVDTQAHYWQGTTGWQTPPTSDEISNALNYRITGWSRLWVGPKQGANAQAVVKQALASGAPVAIGFPVYRDFMSLGKHTNYTTTSGTSLGGHMVAAVGYDSTGVIIRNSWGTSWGNAGDAHLSWSFVTSAVNAAYTVAGLNTPAEETEMAPSVAALSANRGVAAGGTSVTITGSGLDTATGVSFGAVPASFTPTVVNGVTKLVATAPAAASAGTVDVTVTNGAGTSATGTAGKFTYVPNPPAVAGLNPSSVVVYGGTVVTVTGTDLTGVKSVKVGTRAVSAKPVSGTSFTFTAPALAVGSYPVVVTTAYGTSQAATLTYRNPDAPVIADGSVATASTYKTTALTLTGSNFYKGTVTLGGKRVSAGITDTKITLTLPKGAAGPVDLVVSTLGGTATYPVTYVAPAAPTVSGLSVSTGLPSKAVANVVITGTALTDASAVTVGGTRASSLVKLSDTQVRVTVPAKPAGVYDVQVTTPGGTSGTGVKFTYAK